MFEEVIKLFVRQVVVVTIDVLNHLLPSIQRRGGRGDIDELNVLALQFLFPRCHCLMTSTTRTTPGCPHIDKDSFALILVENGGKDILRCYVIMFLIVIFLKEGKLDNCYIIHVS